MSVRVVTVIKFETFYLPKKNLWFLGDDQLKKHPVYIPCTIEDAYIFYLADLANWQIGLKAWALRYFDYDMYSCPTGRDEDDWSDEKKRGSTGVEILMYRSTNHCWYCYTTLPASYVKLKQ